MWHRAERSMELNGALSAEELGRAEHRQGSIEPSGALSAEHQAERSSVSRVEASKAPSAEHRVERSGVG
jgi:hypothetical protein